MKTIVKDKGLPQGKGKHRKKFAINENTDYGEDDDFIPPRHSREMYERTAGEKDLKLIPDAGHAESVLTEPENYQRYVKEFLDTLN